MNAGHMKYTWTKSKSDKWKKKRGKGTGKDYVPWLTPLDVPSIGKSTFLKGWKVGRTHDLLSSLECKYCLLLNWADNVIDIREQYPLLDVDDAISIAEEAGIEYPYSTHDKTPYVLSTDFLITVIEDGKKTEVARTCKYVEDLDDPRIIEKFEIERRYYAKRGIDWGIVTEGEIPEMLITNLEMLYPNVELPTIGKNQTQIDDYCSVIIHRISTKDMSLNELCSELDKELFLNKGDTKRLVAHMIANKLLRFDMKTKFDPYNMVTRDLEYSPR